MLNAHSDSVRLLRPGAAALAAYVRPCYCVKGQRTCSMWPGSNVGRWRNLSALVAWAPPHMLHSCWLCAMHTLGEECGCKLWQPGSFDHCCLHAHMTRIIIATPGSVQQAYALS